MMNTDLITEAKVWVKRKNGHGEIIRVMLATDIVGKVTGYNLYTAFDKNPDYLGRILFDTKGYWIYDGSVLSIVEQEQLASFIIDYIKKRVSAISNKLS